MNGLTATGTVQNPDGTTTTTYSGCTCCHACCCEDNPTYTLTHDVAIDSCGCDPGVYNCCGTPSLTAASPAGTEGCLIGHIGQSCMVGHQVTFDCVPHIAKSWRVEALTVCHTVVVSVYWDMYGPNGSAHVVYRSAFPRDGEGGCCGLSLTAGPNWQESRVVYSTGASYPVSQFCNGSGPYYSDVCRAPTVTLTSTCGATADPETPGEPGAARAAAPGPSPDCDHRGDDLTGAEREARGLSHAGRWALCMAPGYEREGEAVCPCTGCGPDCPRYAAAAY